GLEEAVPEQAGALALEYERHELLVEGLAEADGPDAVVPVGVEERDPVRRLAEQLLQLLALLAEELPCPSEPKQFGLPGLLVFGFGLRRGRGLLPSVLVGLGPTLLGVEPSRQRLLDFGLQFPAARLDSSQRGLEHRRQVVAGRDGAQFGQVV